MRLFRPTLRIRMALLYGGLVLLVGVSLLFTSVVLLNRSISQLPFYENSSKGQLTITDGTGRSSSRATRRSWCSKAQTTAVNYLLHDGARSTSASSS